MEFLGVLGVLALWGAFGAAPWLAALIASRGRAPLWGLALALAAGVGAGALVPTLAAKDLLGFWVSLGTALAAGAAVSAGALHIVGRGLQTPMASRGSEDARLRS